MYAANLIECAELKGDTVDTFGEGIADVDAAHRLDESEHLDKILRLSSCRGYVQSSFK